MTSKIISWLHCYCHGLQVICCSSFTLLLLLLQSLAFGNTKEGNNLVRFRNDCAGVTLACEDGQQVEAHKVILAEQVLVNKSHSQHHISTSTTSMSGKRQQLGVDGQASWAKSYSYQVAELLQVFFSLGC